MLGEKGVKGDIETRVGQNVLGMSTRWTIRWRHGCGVIRGRNWNKY